MAAESNNPETQVLHAGYRADPTTGAVAVPIYQTTSYQFEGTEHAKKLFALEELGNIYTRIMNPTADVLEQRISALEGGAAALAVSSGQAASAMAIQNIAKSGDNIVSSTDLYGGTWNLFANTLSQQGIEVRFVDPADPENFRKATDANTRAYYVELEIGRGALNEGLVTPAVEDTDGSVTELEVKEFRGIASDSSPIRFRACFEVADPEAVRAAAAPAEDPVPLTAPGWFDCFDARVLGEDIASGAAEALLGGRNVLYGIDRIVALYPDGRAYAWDQINRCGARHFDGDPVPDGCPPPPGR